MHPFEDLQVPRDGIGLHWFGQSSFGLRHPDGSILQTDPYYPRHRPAEQFVHARPPLMEESLRTDWVLLTHDHGDHTCMESIDRIRSAFPEVRFAGPPESCERLGRGGVSPDRITELTAGVSADLGPFIAHAVWAKPPGGDPAAGIEPPDVQHLGYVVDAGAMRLYLSGDPINNLADHEELLAPIRELEPHVGLMTTHPTEGEFPFFEGCARVAGALGLGVAVPAHYGCFVSRDYDPHEWAGHLPDGIDPLIIPYNQSCVLSL